MSRIFPPLLKTPFPGKAIIKPEVLFLGVGVGEGSFANVTHAVVGVNAAGETRMTMLLQCTRGTCELKCQDVEAISHLQKKNTMIFASNVWLCQSVATGAYLDRDGRCRKTRVSRLSWLFASVVDASQSRVEIVQVTWLHMKHACL